MKGLIKVGFLNFERKPEQGFNNNPLPNYAEARISVIEKEMYFKRDVQEVETSMEKVFKALVKPTCSKFG